MANRPDRNRNKSTTAKKKTQAEINRIKPAGTLTFDVLKQKSTRITTINVKLPDGDVLEFYHLPMTIDQAEEFFDTISGKDENGESKTVSDIIVAKKTMLTNQLVNKDGSKFVQSIEDWGPIDTEAVTAIADAIMESPRSEAGED